MMRDNVPALKPLVYKQMNTRFDAECGVLWYSMEPKPRPCFTMDLLEDFRKYGKAISQYNGGNGGKERAEKIRYAVLASGIRGVFSYGGDLAFFIQMVQANSREGLSKYAKACIDAMFSCWVGYHSNIVTIALVQGDAFGGGFEAALGNHIIIAEKDARFGLPEILFNLFPGMGAYSLLSRRLDSVRAEKMILSGRIYTAAELHEMGIVDVLAENGKGETALYRYIRAHKKRMNTLQSILKVRQRCNPLTYEELEDVAELWVDAALQLGPKDLRMMERLVRSQEKLNSGSSVSESVGQGFA
jgi:DSF synthase